MSNAAQLLAELRESFDSGRTRPLSFRKAQLQRLDAMLREREAAIFAACAADLGKPPFESYLTESGFCAAEVRHALKNLARWNRPERVAAPLIVHPARADIHREPFGVALILGPWNFPVQLVIAPLIGAIAAGNCAVIKPSEVAPATSKLLAELIPAYLDPACYRVVEGGMVESQALLAQHFDVIFYTGGTRVGKVVMEAAAKHLTPVVLELGGKNPCIVARDANLAVAARRIAWGKYFNTGQACVAPDFVLVEKTVEQPLLAALKHSVLEFYGAAPNESAHYGRMINATHFQRVVQHLRDGTIFLGGEHDADTRYIAPTILTDVRLDSPVMTDEIFGPILPVVPVESVDEAIRFVRARPKPLALYLFTGDRNLQRRIVNETSSGGVCINDVVAQYGAPELPFGGVGNSGMGACHGRANFESFSHRKSVLTKWRGVDPPLRYPPYSASRFAWIRRILG